MIVITNGTEYIYIDADGEIQKTTDLTKAKTFTFQGCSIFIRENVKATKGFYAYDTETQRICYRRRKKKCFPKTTRMMIYNQADGRCVLQDCYILQDDPEEDYYNADQVITLRAFPNISLTLAEIFENRD